MVKARKDSRHGFDPDPIDVPERKHADREGIERSSSRDMKEIAELGMKEDPTMIFAYESPAWGTYVTRREECWDIVEQVDMPNFGIVLDTFNIAARVYANPALPTCTNPERRCSNG